jgi:replication fork protection complex subunit Csm3/Swi3
MSPAAPTHSRAQPDALDEMLDQPNYDQAVDDFLRDIPTTNNTTNASNAPNADESSKDPDAEVKVRKPRKPVPKLDEKLLLSDAGVPKLRRTAKTKLKFKGKGHEFSDISRLSSMYQLWLDDMYPRAKFRDALAMVEKLGHSKRMQITRKAWIDATKPSRREESPERREDVADVGEGEVVTSGGLDVLPEPEGEERTGSGARDTTGNAQSEQNSHGDEVPEDDELDALMAEHDEPPAESAKPPAQKPRRGPFEEDGPEEDEMNNEDELDALMAEEESRTNNTANKSKQSGTQAASNAKTTESEPANDFADEEDVLAEMGW